MVKAEHFIYTRLRASYSTNQASGYQLACRSSGLEPDEAQAIIKLIGGYNCSSENHRRYLFTIHNDKAIFAHSCLIKNKDIVHEGGSRAHLLHSLTIDAESFYNNSCNPFTILREYPFVTTPEKVIESFDKKTGLAHAIDLENYSNKPIQLEKNYSPDILKKLCALSLNQEQLKEQQASLLIKEEPKNILYYLEIMAALLHPKHRLQCSVVLDDCVAESCFTHQKHTPEAGKFWLLGKLEPPTQNGFITLKVSPNSLKISEPQLTTSLSKNNPYYYWLANTQEDSIGTLINLATNIQYATSINSSGEGQNGWEEISNEACNSFLKVHKRSLRKRLIEILSQQFSSQTAMEIATFAEKITAKKEFLKIATVEDASTQAIADLVLDWIIDNSRKIDKHDARDLLNYAKEVEDSRLLFLGTALGQRPSSNQRDKALSNISHSDYEKLLNLSVISVDPHHFIKHPNQKLLFKVKTLENITDEQMLSLFNAALTENIPHYLNDIAELVSNLSSKDILKKIIVKYKKKNVPEDEFYYRARKQLQKLQPHEKDERNFGKRGFGRVFKKQSKGN